MRHFALCLTSFTLSTVAVLSSGTLFAQDPSQQIQQNVMLATQQAQQANAAAMAANQQAAQNAAAASSMTQPAIPRPKFSLKPGSFTSPQTLRLSDSERGATIYYTTDGWAPTPSSTPYEGPITIDATTHVQAIAFVTGRGSSLVADAMYVLPAAPAAAPATTPQVLAGPDGVLHRGTPVSLIFAASVDSQTAQVGDKVPLKLERAAQVGTQLISPADATGQATILHVDRSGAAGAPGVLTFRVDYLKLQGVTVPLLATDTAEGQDKVKKVLSLFWVPVVGAAALAVHGQSAEIQSGTPVVAKIAEDTSILPVLPAS